jgi:hypothetical protein
MSADDLWNLHEKICALLLRKLDAEKQEFERRLNLKHATVIAMVITRGRADRTRRCILNIAIRSSRFRLGLNGTSGRVG